MGGGFCLTFPQIAENQDQPGVLFDLHSERLKPAQRRTVVRDVDQNIMDLFEELWKIVLVQTTA